MCQYKKAQGKQAGTETCAPTYEKSVKRQPQNVGGQREHHEPHATVLHGKDQPPGDALVLGVGVGLAHVLDHAQLGNVALLVGEAAGVVGQVGQDDEGGEGDEHGDGALDPEEPAPGGVAEGALHVGQDAGGDEGGEGVGDEVAAKEDGVAGGELAARVPLGQNEQGARQKGGLDEAEAEAHDDHAGEAADDARQGRDEAPDEHDAAQVQRGAGDAVHEHVRGDLHEDVADVEDAQARLVLGVGEAEVGLQALEAGGGDVVAVEVVHDVDGDEEGAAGVELALEAPLDGGAVLGGHMGHVEVVGVVGRDDLEVLDFGLGGVRPAGGGARDVVGGHVFCGGEGIYGRGEKGRGRGKRKGKKQAFEVRLAAGIFIQRGTSTVNSGRTRE